jgi:2-dehydropantoate 2-reductase
LYDFISKIKMGHIGLTPQRLSALGGFRVQGNTSESAKSIFEDAKALEKAGCFSLVIESVPEKVAKYITENISIPTIGIGAGKHTSGQVLVYHDVLGLYSDFQPKFVKRFANLKTNVVEALTEYKREVEERSFPAKEHTFIIKKTEFMNAFPDAKQEETEVKQIQEFKPEKRLKVVVIGAGSLGTFFTAKLSESKKCDVILLSSDEKKISKFNENGLFLKSKEFNIENLKRLTVKFTTNIDEIKKDFGEVDLVIIAVKSPYTQEAALKASKIISKNGYVLTIQNGIGNAELIKKEIKSDRVIAGVTYQGSHLGDDGVISHNGNGITTISTSEMSNDIKELFNKSGIETEISENIEETQWGKLIVNSAINPITALFGVKNGFLTENGELNEISRLMVHSLVKEAVIVAMRKGIKLPYENAYEKTIEVAKKTFENESSMLSDFSNGNETEIDFINGKIIEEANKYGVSCEMNKKIVSMIQSKSKSFLELLN